MSPDDPLWDAPLEEVPLAFLDLEMTGCDPGHDRICEVAIHRVVRGELEQRVVSLVDPGSTVGASVAIHRIDDDALRGAPVLRDLQHELERALEGAIPVGHAVAFDLAFLRAAEERGEIVQAPTLALDTRGLAQRALRAGSASLASLARDLELPRPAHRAEPDVIATRALFDAVCAVLRPATARHLLLAQDVGGRASLREDVERVLRDAHERQVAVRVCYRVPGRSAIVDELDVWALEPPRVEGWLHRKSIRRALRGDRLLWVEATDLPFARRAPHGFAPTIPRSTDADQAT